MFKIYQSREEAIEDIRQGSMGEEVKQAIKEHIAHMERLGLPPSLLVFLDDRKRKER